MLVDIVNAIIAGLALILSVASLYWQYSEKVPRLKIEPIFEKTLLPVKLNLGVLEPEETLILRLHIVNIKNIPIHAAKYYLDVSKGQKVILQHEGGYQRFPTILEPNRSYDYLVWAQKLHNELKILKSKDRLKVTAIIEDEVGRKYKSPKFTIRIQQLMN